MTTMSAPELLPKDVIDFAESEINRLKTEIHDVQYAIWENPELSYQETFAHKVLTDFMDKQKDWEVIKGAYDIDTAFVCTFTNNPSESTPVVSYNAEYDALPGMGHGCGHNLISACGLVASLATALAMKKFDIAGTVKLFGTPAEEDGGGKIKLLDAGAYDGVDVTMMGHGLPYANAYAFTTAITSFKVEFYGKEAHAAASPWEGVNALDAMVLMYNGVSVLRQQLMPKDIVQYNIIDGGMAPNIITGFSSAKISVRAPTLGRRKVVEEKVMNCIKAAALATGCKYKIIPAVAYDNMLCNDVLAECYTTYMNNVFDQELPPTVDARRDGFLGASTDQGNLSWVMPSLHPMFVVQDEGNPPPHSKGFTAAAGLEKNYNSAVMTGKALAFIGLELLIKPELLKQVKDQFEVELAEAKKDLPDATTSISNISELIYRE